MWEMACNMPEASDVRLQINIYLKKKKKQEERKKRYQNTKCIKETKRIIGVAIR
jgi:hypothetical protein